MSAVPVAALVLGGTSALPSSVAFILSAKAGPANANVAANASDASVVLLDMIFLLDMAFSLLTANDGVRFKTAFFRIYSRKGRRTRQISWKPFDESAAILSLRVQAPHDGLA